MPDSITSAFSEPEDFIAALRVEGFLSLLMTARGQFRARLAQVSLNQIRLSAAEEQLPRIAFVQVPADTMLIFFPVGSVMAPVCGGISMHSGELITLGPGEQFHARTSGASHWGAIRLVASGLVKYGVALTGVAFSIAPTVRLWRPPHAAGRRLRSLHAAAIRMAAKHPQMLVDTVAAHGLEQQLLYAIVECLSRGSVDTTSRGERRSQEIVVQFEELLQNGQSVKASTTEICTALQVSERRLRSACAAHLGMSPTRYDRLRRMSLVRRALRYADPAPKSVSSVARDNGFHDLGRFAISYRATFGEPPSTTLRRGPRFSL